MTELIENINKLENGEFEIQTSAMDDICDDITFFQKGNDYTDEGYIAFNLISDVLWNKETISDELAEELKSIANHWNCDFNEKKEFTTKNTDRNQAIINLIQCTSAAIGYCWAIAEQENE
ncbi:MAG: hypothetical protein J6573_04675 [Lactobacillus sp.]|nr:hypothetical protein [Lactobacillus sp.]